MDTNLEGPLRKLASALHGAIEGSPEVEEALSALRERGFQAMLLLEVTVALTKPGGADSADSPADEQGAVTGESDVPRAERDWLVELPPRASADEGAGADPTPIPASDREFLRSLRIRID